MEETCAPPSTSAESEVPPRRTYRIAGPQTWALARELYLAGLPAPEVASRLNVSVHNLRKKATREKWSRRAHAELVLDVRLPKVGGDRIGGGPDAVGPAHSAAPPLEVDEWPPEADPAEAAVILWRRAAGAALAGGLERAQALAKLADLLGRETRAPAWREPDPVERFSLDARPREPPPTPKEIERIRELVESKVYELHAPQRGGEGLR